MNENAGDKLDTIIAELSNINKRIDDVSSSLSDKIDSVNSNLEAKLNELATTIKNQLALVLEDTGVIRTNTIVTLAELGISIDIVVEAMDSTGTAKVIFRGEEEPREMKLADVIAIVKSKYHEARV